MVAVFGRYKIENLPKSSTVLIKAFTGLPADAFWELVKKVDTELPEYERQRHERPGRQRAVGGGRNFNQPLVIRVMLILEFIHNKG